MAEVKRGSRGRGNSTWSYRSPGAPSRRCCRRAWSARSGPPAAPGARSAAPTTTWSWASPTPPGRCRSSCAGTRPAGPAPGWTWRRSLGGGEAETGTQKEKHIKNSQRHFKLNLTCEMVLLQNQSQFDVIHMKRFKWLKTSSRSKNNFKEVI